MEHKQTISGFVSKVKQAGAATRVLLGSEPSSDSNHFWLSDSYLWRCPNYRSWVPPCEEKFGLAVSTYRGSPEDKLTGDRMRH